MTAYEWRSSFHRTCATRQCANADFELLLRLEELDMRTVHLPIQVFTLIFLPFVRPAMIRSELRSALRRCPTEEEAGGGASVQPVGQLQSLIAQRMQRAQELLEEMRLQVWLLHLIGLNWKSDGNVTLTNVACCD